MIRRSGSEIKTTTLSLSNLSNIENSSKVGFQLVHLMWVSLLRRPFLKACDLSPKIDTTQEFLSPDQSQYDKDEVLFAYFMVASWNSSPFLVLVSYLQVECSFHL
jgi:hypothetical protein